MSERDERRFQSGQEVLEEYVPDYGDPDDTEAKASSKSLGDKAGAQLARDLLAQFRQRVVSK